MPQMKTTDLSEGAVRRLRRALLAVLVAMLAGCGPGTGGTGTGPEVQFAGSTAGTGVPPASQCVGSCTNVLLVVGATATELSGPCVRFVHEGTWLRDGEQEVVLPGLLVRTAGGAARIETGSLRLQGAPDIATASQLSLSLSDAAGQPVLGPLMLQRQAPGDAAPVTCRS